jgi:acetylornithine deacetylase/succinyl-diaminopimelate desuccinylase-like protein
MAPIRPRRNSFLALMLFASAALGGGALAGDVSDAERAIKPEDALAKVKVLASDELEGRRAGTAAGRKAREWIFGQLKALGLAPEFQVFEVGGTRCSNVIAVLEGTRRGEEHVVIGAHYDHVGRGEDGNGIDFLGG